ncbi:MAG TPA: hypothetical protein DCF33_08680 [Saprospirales bacterium]|nr:hypothetical protein [Saprospirales bacterium]
MHKIHKTFGLFGSDLIFCVWHQAEVAPTFVSTKTDRKVETFLRRLSESSVDRKDHMKAAWHSLPKLPPSSAPPKKAEQEKGEITERCRGPG